MRFCIPIGDHARGGMYVFLRQFRRFLTQGGHSITEDPEDSYDVLFVNSFMVPYRLVRLAKQRNPDITIVQRVDGAARDYGRSGESDMEQALVSLLADVAIFQSEYGLYATRHKFDVIRRDGPVIHNPVDVLTFCPEGEKAEVPGSPNVCHTTFSTNPLKGVASLYAVARQNRDINFLLCGRYENPPALPNLHLLDALSHDDLACVYRASDAFLTFTENDTCPNTVIEALATGLPVLYRRSGGTPELVADCGAAVEVNSFRSEFDAIMKERSTFAAAARSRALESFAPDVIFPQYMNAINGAIPTPLPGLRETLPVYLRGHYAWWGLARGWFKGLVHKSRHLFPFARLTPRRP